MSLLSLDKKGTILKAVSVRLVSMMINTFVNLLFTFIYVRVISLSNLYNTYSPSQQNHLGVVWLSLTGN